MVTHEEPLDHYLNRLIYAVEAISDRLFEIEAHLHDLPALRAIVQEMTNLVEVVEEME